MPPRLNKRQIREQEELAALDIKNDSLVEEESEKEVLVALSKTHAFAAVGLA